MNISSQSKFEQQQQPKEAAAESNINQIGLRDREDRDAKQ